MSLPVLQKRPQLEGHPHLTYSHYDSAVITVTVLASRRSLQNKEQCLV
jgi:hypothetical protein